MKVFFTGATGVIGREAVPLLISAGHEVKAVARSEPDHNWLAEIGARPIAVDLFDRAAVYDAVGDAEVVIHMATAIPSQARMPKRDSWTMNDRLRTEATGYLIDAALNHGVGVFIQQSISFVYADGGDEWIDEDSEIDAAWDVLDSALDAERHVARFAEAGCRGVVLRFSSLYGPGPASAEYISSVAARKLPIVGRGHNYVSHLHVADAATAIEASISARVGLYNVSDDNPVTKRDEMTSLAETLGTKTPRSVPRWIARAGVGPAVNMLTVSQRVSNTHFKSATGWTPRFPSVTEGWADAIARSVVAG